MKIEIQILFGFNCNFKCAHCINESGPGVIDRNLTDEEVKLLLREIAFHETVEVVSFSGGEPLLYLHRIAPMIQELRRVRPGISISITTNGSLLTKFETDLKALAIDRCLISTDDEHQHFIQIEKLITNIQAGIRVFKQVEINHTYDTKNGINLSSALTEICLNEGIRINFTPIVKGGRSSLLLESKPALKTISCPNINSDFVKISYIPKRGFSTCCGPLVFDDLAPTSSLFFKSISELKENFLFQFFKNVKGKMLKLKRGNDCDNCSDIFETNDFPALKKTLFQSNWQNLLFKYNQQVLELHSKVFHPKYVKLARTRTIRNPFANLPNDTDYEVRQIDGLSIEEIQIFSKFTIETFFNKFTDEYSESAIDRFKGEQSAFFQLKNKAIFNYFKGELVGCIVLGFFEAHPYFQEPVWHIGYWGIKKDNLDYAVSEKIKSDWCNYLIRINSNASIVALVDHFNTASLRFSEKLNFQEVAVRLDNRT